MTLFCRDAVFLSVSQGKGSLGLVVHVSAMSEVDQAAGKSLKALLTDSHRVQKSAVNINSRTELWNLVSISEN